jgi:transcriptional regulator with XRE-family HTH domain
MSARIPEHIDENQSFGRRLRAERERRRIDLALIAENSKISVSLLRDLERDDASRWPTGIFRRAFIRAYAEGVGLDPDETLREFLERFPDPHEPRPAGRAAPGTGSPLRLTLADGNGTFLRGRLLQPVHTRLAAVACDAFFVTMLGLALYAALGVWWMPISVVLVGYYSGSILLLGNTPGVCLCAPGRAPIRPPDGTSLRQRLRSAADSLWSAVGLKVPLSHPPGS